MLSSGRGVVNVEIAVAILVAFDGNTSGHFAECGIKYANTFATVGPWITTGNKIDDDYIVVWVLWVDFVALGVTLPNDTFTDARGPCVACANDGRDGVVEYDDAPTKVG